MTNSVIEIKDLSYRYEENFVLEQINLIVPKGAFLGIVGPNGSGKSTLIKLLLGILKPQSGTIKLFGQDSKSFKHYEKIGYVSQKANSFNSGFPATVYEVVLSGLTKKLGLFKFPSKADKEKVVAAIKLVEMEDFLYRNIGELSGGQQQRVFIARALVSNPELLILDEPTVGVDAKRVESFYSLLEKLNQQQGITLLLVTHDVGTITNKVTHVACLNKHLHFHGLVTEFENLEQKSLSGVYGHDIHLLTHQH
ncbi:metal ABC transporter ATP-binding protein [Bacillus carboniphilus]|uniref:Metal ABC transporter ATP-binding protein n=1 Tax=Bacillus carboniphilus TaxID=86663 RepID=A0ABN0WLP3_9BACI